MLVSQYHNTDDSTVNSCERLVRIKRLKYKDASFSLDKVICPSYIEVTLNFRSQSYPSLFSAGPCQKGEAGLGLSFRLRFQFASSAPFSFPNTFTG